MLFPPGFGRLSVRITSFSRKLAAPVPLFDTVIVQTHGAPSTVLPLTLFVFTGVRSGPVTVTALLQSLLVSLDSGTFDPGSTRQMPGSVGLVNVPVADGVAVTCTVNEPGAAMLTGPPLAVHDTFRPTRPQAIVPVPVIPD